MTRKEILQTAEKVDIAGYAACGGELEDRLHGAIPTHLTAEV